MIDRLVEYALSATREELAQLGVQDAALCDVWHKSYQGDAARLKAYEKIPAVIVAWAEAAYRETEPTEGRRHQWVLREAIDALQYGRVSSMTWDEAQLLLSAHDLSARASDPDHYLRVVGLIRPHIEAVRARVSALNPTPGLPTISSRLHVVTDEDILRSRPREIKLFAGVPLQARGPVLIHEKGHLKVIRQVPENCTVVVEDGSISVEGFVMGRVAASNHCEVRDNISGMVIVRQGDVRARGIMVRAFVVSKWGSIHCRQAESPELLFAGEEICVEGSTTMGVMKAPVITVHGEVNGGTFHATKNISALSFRNSETRKLSIVLRHDLTCQDYGEDPGPDGLRLLGKANRLKRQLAAARERIAFTHGEAEHVARCAVTFLLGGDSANPVAEKLQRAQHRLSLVNRVTSVFTTLIGMAEERLERLARYEGRIIEEDADSLQEHTSSLNEVHADFTQLETEGDPEADIRSEMQDIASFKERLFSPGSDMAKVAQTLDALRERLRVWKREREQLLHLIAKQESGVQVLQGASERVRNANTAMPMVHFLRQLITLLRERGDAPNSPQMLRLQSGFMRVAMRSINSRVERAERDKRTIEKMREQLREIAERLRKEFQIAFSDDDRGDSAGPRVTGMFDAGVRLYADAYLLADGTSGKGAVFETTGSANMIQTYTREAGRIVNVD